MPIYMRNGWRRPRSDVYAKLSLQGVLAPYGVNAHSYWPGDGARWGVAASNYQNSALSPTGIDTVMGLSLDALQAMTLGSELVTNGANLVTTTGWTATALSGAPASLSVSGGSLVVTNTGTTYGVAAQTVPVTSGLTYQVTALLTKGTAAAVNIRVGSTAFGYEYTDQAATGIAVPITVTFKATSSNVFISLLNTNTPDGTGIYGKISVREIPGIHATQGTTANKAILRRGLLNQLLQSTSFTSPWATTGASIVPSATTYNNGDAAVLFQETAGGTWHELCQPSLSFTAGSPVTLAFIAKKSTSTAFQLFVTSSVKLNAYANFNLNAGSLGAVGAGATSSIADLGGGWYLTVLNVTPASTVSHYAYTCLINGDVNSVYDPSYSGALGNGVYLYRAGLFQGTLTAQQILDAGGIPLTTSAAASNPGAGRYWAQFDGANDFMGLAAPPFQLSDDHCVLAYCLPTLPGALQVLVSPSYSDGSNYAGVLGIDATGKPFAEWNATTGGTRRITGPSSIIGQVTLLACRKVGNTKTLWVNGTLVGSDSTAQTGSVAASAYLGCWNGSSLYYQWYLGPSVLIKGTVGDASLADISRLILISQL